MSVVQAKELTKIFRLYASPKDRLREILTLRRRRYHHEFRALDAVTFSVERGQTIGIIGMNGSGKSTLLKILCGVLQPTSGSVEVHGRVAALLELGAGFHPEFTGRENVYVGGALSGFNREEMDRRLPDIEAFAEVGEYIDQPVKLYSSGMFVRLAFAAAVHVDPDILIVDEALSVGDTFFQHRCLSKIEALQAEGKTVLFVTHDVNLAKSFCRSVLLMDNGRMLEYGEPEYVTERYLMLTREKQTKHAAQAFQVARKAETMLDEAKVSFGSAGGQILQVRVLDEKRSEARAFLAGEPIVIEIRAGVEATVQHPSVSIVLRDQRGYNVYGTSTAMQGQTLSPDEQRQVRVFFLLSPVLRAGSYSLAVSLDDARTPSLTMLVDRQVGVGAFEVIEPATRFLGVIDLDAETFFDDAEITARCAGRRGTSLTAWSDRSRRSVSKTKRNGNPMSDRYKPPVDPLVIGALGGSGTRVVARLVRRAGYFIGTNLNESEDALDFVEFYDRWINRFVRAESSALDSTERGEMEQEFWRCVERHRASLSNAEARWGWKEPRSIYLLRFFNELFPGMRFIHVIRDGRDMAFSSNQNQLRKHGDAVLGDLHDGTAPPIRTALLWSRVNLAAAEYGQTQMAGRYLALRFEDLCTEPARWIRQIYDFVGVSYGVDLAEAVEEIARPATIGRWRECTDTKLVEGVQASAGEALQRFGYLPGPKRPITSGSS